MRSLLFFLFFCTMAFAQEVNIAKDTIQMKEVIIKEDFSKFKDATVKIKGNCRHPETMSAAPEIVTLVENLPTGYLESVTFNFNEMHYESYRSDRKKFEDTEFEVVLYKVNPDNTPGERIMRDEKYIKIMKVHTGEARVHFLEFNIKDQRKLFIGLRSTAGIRPKREFYIDCICDSNKHLTYSRLEPSSGWNKYTACAAIKMEVNVLVSPE